MERYSWMIKTTKVKPFDIREAAWVKGRTVADEKEAKSALEAFGAFLFGLKDGNGDG